MAERRRRIDEINDALRSAPALSMTMDAWVRIVSARYANSPLHATGSLITGGRFNVGADADNRISPVFPAMYIAENYNVAYREFYQIQPNIKVGGLTPEELSLNVSVANFRIDGVLHNIFDASSLTALEPVATVLALIRMPERAEELMTKLGTPGQIVMLANAADLRNELHSQHWRQWPSQFGIPSASQQFADIVQAAGFNGIYYGSTKADGHCVAVFPHNLRDDGSYLQLKDPCEDSVQPQRVDSDTADAACGWHAITTGDLSPPQ